MHLLPSDNTYVFHELRVLNGFHQLDGLEFIGQIGWVNDFQGKPQKTIARAITSDHKEYQKTIGQRELNSPSRDFTEL